MKRRIFAVLLCAIVVLSCAGLTAFAEEDDKAVIDNSIFFVDIPDGYIFSKDFSQNYYVVDSDFGSQTMEFFVEGNLMFPQGVSKATDEEIIAKVKRITQWGSDFTVTEVKRQVINGQNAVILVGVDEFLYDTYNEIFVFTTKEAVCAVVTYASEESDKKEIDKIMSTFTMNGTYFEGDAPVIKHDFSNSPDYYTAITEYSQDFYEYEEELDDGIFGVVGGVLIGMLLIPAVIIALIVFIILWNKNKKIVKEYERYFGPIYAVRNAVRVQQMQANGYATINPQQGNSYAQPYQPQPMNYGNQPYQPVVNQQPVNQAPVQAPIINGIPQDENKQ